MTEEQKISELMKPRYKVIADWPNSEFMVGDIIKKDVTGNKFTKFTLKGYVAMQGRYMDKYPHLFKRLEWWEERTPEEMPDYVKGQSCIYKVTKWRKDKDGDFYFNYQGDDDQNIGRYCQNTLPATSTDYQSFLNQPST